MNSIENWRKTKLFIVIKLVLAILERKLET